MPNSPGSQGLHWFAQVRAMFARQIADGEQQQLALVRWYEHADSITALDMLALSFGCRRLRWAEQLKQSNRVPHYTDKYSQQAVYRARLQREKLQSQVEGPGPWARAIREHFYVNPFL